MGPLPAGAQYLVESSLTIAVYISRSLGFCSMTSMYVCLSAADLDAPASRIRF